MPEEKRPPSTSDVSPPKASHESCNATPIDADNSHADVDLPHGWKYKRFNILGFRAWYASPKVQLGMLSFVCFLCPGMFNALAGLGGGGKTDATLADNMNTALYSAYAVFGFFGGTFVNKLGVKWTLAFGGSGYCIYAASLLASVHTSVPGFNIFAGILLGVCAGLLWTAQGTIMISYPNEDQKGRYFAWFWGIFNMGAVIGGLIPLGENIHAKGDVTVSDGTYIGFIVLMFLGAILALLLCNANDIIRHDGTRVILMKNPSWQSELVGLWETLLFEPLVVLLFPMFFTANWFYTYQFNAVNGAYFSTRTKALNSLLYWLAQIIAAAIWGYLLDVQLISRSLRAKLIWGMLFVLIFAIWGGGFAFEQRYTRETVDTTLNPEFEPMDWTTSGYLGPMFLYIFYGFFDAAWQASTYWFIGALSNSGRRSANYVGFYKGMQGIGTAVANNLDARKLSFRSEFISNWVLLSSSLVVAAPIIFLKIRDHVTIEEDLQGTDETVADVLPRGHPEKATV